MAGSQEDGDRLATPGAEAAIEIQLEQLGFPKERPASLDARQPIEQVCEALLSRHPDGAEGVAKATVPCGDSGTNVEPCCPLKRAKTMVHPRLLRGMSLASQEVLKRVSSRHVGVSNMAVVRLLLRASAALRQGLLDQEQRQQLHIHLESGDIDLVHAVVLGIGVQNEPTMPLDEGQEKWECCICFSEQEEHGWLCPNEHRYCSECMAQHVDSVQFPRCPTVSCGYQLEEKDLVLLPISSNRIESFREAKLRGAIDSLDTTGKQQAFGSDSRLPMASSNAGLHESSASGDDDVLVRCPNETCQNAVLMPRRVRQRYACICGSVPFCTHCRLAPYHYHAACSEVQPLRQRWLEWLSGGRDDYFGRARASESFDKQLQALREATQRHKELEADEEWKAKRCRLCPNCSRPVQKLSGCDSMHCGADAHGGNTQPGCGTTFEWHAALPYKASIESKELPLPTAEDVRCRGHTTLHPFVDCSVCGTRGKGIVGPRFRCLHCKSFEVCQACEPKLVDIHPPDHVFQILLESDFSWAGIRLPVGTKVRLVRHGDVLPINLEESITCIVDGCSRIPWNGKRGQTCCRTCFGSCGKNHGEDCERKSQIPSSANASSKFRLEGLCGSVARAPGGSVSRKRPRDETPKRYEWQSDRGRWHAYDGSANAAIVEGALRGARSVQIVISGQNYTIDFRHMQQRNRSTGGSRPVRAVPDLAAVQSTTASDSAGISQAIEPYTITLDQGGDVVVQAVHLEPILQSRAEAEELIAKALTEQEDGIPEPPAVDEDEGNDDEEEENEDEDEDEEWDD